MSRRSEAAPIGPWWARPSHYELRLIAALRKTEDGRWAVGTDAWAACSTCGLLRDTGEFAGCIGCLAYHAQRERERWARYALEDATKDSSQH